jgi:hypothetical protein
MQTSLDDPRSAQRSATVFHPISEADKNEMAGLRAIRYHHGARRCSRRRDF